MSEQFKIGEERVVMVAECVEYCHNGMPVVYDLISEAHALCISVRVEGRRIRVGDVIVVKCISHKLLGYRGWWYDHELIS